MRKKMLVFGIVSLLILTSFVSFDVSAISIKEQDKIELTREEMNNLDYALNHPNNVEIDPLIRDIVKRAITRNIDGTGNVNLKIIEEFPELPGCYYVFKPCDSVEIGDLDKNYPHTFPANPYNWLLRYPFVFWWMDKNYEREIVSIREDDVQFQKIYHVDTIVASGVLFKYRRNTYQGDEKIYGEARLGILHEKSKLIKVISKDTYNVGDDIEITVKNIGDAKLELKSPSYFMIYKNNVLGVPKEKIHTEELNDIIYLEPEEEYTWTWNNNLPSGSYYIFGSFSIDGRANTVSHTDCTRIKVENKNRGMINLAFNHFLGKIRIFEKLFSSPIFSRLANLK
jgi:hypothetical protein